MASWVETALSDMRKPGFSGSWFDSYSVHDDQWLERQVTSSSAKRAGCQRGRYMLASECWNSGINPDYADISWVSSSKRADAYRIMPWMETPLGVTYGTTHLPGYTGNTRILMLDCRVAIKSKTSGLWAYHGPFQMASGMLITPNQLTFTGPSEGLRYESAYGGYSCRAVAFDGSADGYSYVEWHGWPSFITVDPTDVADICVTMKTSLILHNQAGTDDREFSRYMFTLAADAYSASGGIGWTGCIGWSRNKFVTAKYPAFQHFVMHTMSEAQFNAAGGYPAQFAFLDDGVDDVENPPDTPIVAPAVGEWGLLTEGGAGAWGTSSATGSPYVSGGLPPPLRRRR